MLAVVGCTPRSTAGAPKVDAVTLFPAGIARPSQVGALELVGAFELRSHDPDFGGISAARLEGEHLVLVSDRSFLFELELPAHDDGQSFELPVLAERRLTTARGEPLDAEALVLGARGNILVGDEASGRVFAFARGESVPEGTPLRLPGPFAEAGAANLGLETLARLPDGSLLAVVEGAASGGGRHVAALLDAAGVQLLSLAASDGFQVTDADAVGSWLFVLERRLSLGGWQSRIVAVALNEGGSIGSTMGRELATISGPILGENYEGLAVRWGPAGSIDLVVVSDSNFTAFQRTQLLQLRWRP
jgi:hypothetical protein